MKCTWCHQKVDELITLEEWPDDPCCVDCLEYAEAEYKHLEDMESEKWDWLKDAVRL